VTYTLENPASNDRILGDVTVFPCAPIEKHVEFYNTNNPMDLKARTFVWNDGIKLSFAGTDLDSEQNTTPAMLKEGCPTINVGWWENAKDHKYKEDVIAIVSRDGQYVVGMAFEESFWVSTRLRGGKSCFHLFPYFGDLGPGDSKTIKGKYYVLKGNEDDLYERYLHDFVHNGLVNLNEK
jgi:hypothetical protein